MAKKGGGTQTVTQTLDPATQKMQQQVYDAARQAAVAPPGVNPYTMQAAGIYQNAANFGMGGFNALAGDPAAIAKLMNPYQQEVVDATRAQYGTLMSDITNHINDEATQAGAFGGSRHGVAEGVALGNLGQAEAQTLAGLNYQGYTDAMQQAAQLANFGMGATGQMAQLGDYIRSLDPSLQRLAILKQGMDGTPYGSTQTTTGQAGHNGVTGFLGGASTGAGIAQALSLGTPWGAVLAGAGGLLGLF